MNDKKLQVLAKRILGQGAVSVFLYGSRARGDAHESSDWELGAIFEDESFKSRSELAKHAPRSVVIYPFKHTQLTAGQPDTPYTKSIWLNEIIRSAKTLAGERIIEDLPLPDITTDDLRNDIAFHKARALDAMVSFRSGYQDLSEALFVKSCLYGCRDLILLSDHNFPVSYFDIAAAAKKYLPDDFHHLVVDSMEIRDEKKQLTLDMAFQNIALFTRVIEPLLAKKKK